MNKCILQKKIDYYINVKNNIWIAIVTTIGGTLTLAFTLGIDESLILKIVKLVFVVVGVILIPLLFNGYFKIDSNIEKLFKKLQKED